jgi:hypothetical protein
MSDNEQNEIRQKVILDFIKLAGLVVDNSLNTLEGQVIPRDLLLDINKYKECQTKIENLRNYLSSSRLTCLQSTAENNQRWPLLNAVRQLLKTVNYKMTPMRISDGYTKDGKKILRRYFRIDKIQSLKIENSTSEK